MGGKLRLLAVAVLALLASVTVSPAAADDTFGMSVNRVINDDFTPSRWDAPLSAVRGSGITVARTDAPWDWAEPRPPFLHVHTFDWTRLDAIAAALAKHGLRWMPVLAYSAHWAATNTTDVHYPPRWNEDYAAFAGAFAKRYGRGGSFWASHPELATLPVTDYEIWNEPNGAWFWKPEPNPTRYGEMYLKARAAIKGADPEGRAVVGGITNDIGFVAAMYYANPKLRGNVDALGWHPYGTDADAVLSNIRAARGVLLGVADPNVPIYVTELGWPTSGSKWPYQIDEPERGKNLEIATDGLLRSDCGVKTVVPYTWTAPERDPSSLADWYGVTHPDGSPTPSATAYERVIAGWKDSPVTDATRVPLCRTLYPPPLPPKPEPVPREPQVWPDTDLDLLGDNVDPDDDNDGLGDKLESGIRTNAADIDSDDDGLADGHEHRVGTDPTRMDTDRDRLPDGVERGVAKRPPDPPGPALGTDPRRFRPDRDPRARENPKRRDTDRDGLGDGYEDRNRNGRQDRRETNPRDADTDDDGVLDRLDRRPRDPLR